MQGATKESQGSSGKCGLRKHPHLRTENAARLLGLDNCIWSDIVIDGGNVVPGPGAVILTEKVYPENPTIGRARLREQLRALLEVEQLILVPKEPYDFIGHADGMVRFVDAGTVLVNDYSRVDAAFGKRLAGVLSPLEIIPFPYCPTGERIDGIDSAVGVYLNFLQVRDMILVPAFGQSHDDEACKILERIFPRNCIVPISCTELARRGGVLNCATWNIRDNDRQ
jgi:agmatine deiminase